MNAIDIIGREKMRESAFARDWVEEGSLITRRADILKVLRLRLKPVHTEEVAAALERVKEPDRLEHLIDVAVTCATLDEFRQALS